jgi:hypothetical protein
MTETERGLEAMMTKAKTLSEELMLAQRTQEGRLELLNKPRRIDPDSADGFVQEDPSTAPPELTGLAALPAEVLKDRLDDAQQDLVKEKEKLKAESDRLAVQTTVLNRYA